MLAADWENLTIAGAFIGGVVVGGFAAIRITRYVLDYLRHEQRKG